MMAWEGIFFKFASFFFGAAFGSFANVCIHRIPKGESIIFPPSRCPFCRTRIRFYDNVPLLSYLVLRGKCRHCSVYIPFRYFLVEAIAAAASLALFAKYGLSVLYFVYFAFVLSLVIISFIDLKHRIIPNVISVPGTVIGLFLSIVLFGGRVDWPVSIGQAIIGMLAGGGALFVVGAAYSALTGREGIGFGDVKLLAMFGAFFGWKGAFFSILLGSVAGIAVAIPFLIVQRKGLRYQIPFGPFLSLGLVSYVWFFKRILDPIFMR